MLYRTVSEQAEWEYLAHIADHESTYESRSLTGLFHLLSNNEFPYASASEKQKAAVRFSVASEVLAQLAGDAVRTRIMAGKVAMIDSGEVYPWHSEAEATAIREMVWSEAVDLDILTERRFLRSLIACSWITVFERADMFTLREAPTTARCARCRYFYDGQCEAREMEAPHVSSCIDYAETPSNPASDRYVRVEAEMVVVDEGEGAEWVGDLAEKMDV